jgi:hypothetical protein
MSHLKMAVNRIFGDRGVFLVRGANGRAAGADCLWTDESVARRRRHQDQTRHDEGKRELLANLPHPGNGLVTVHNPVK